MIELPIWLVAVLIGWVTADIIKFVRTARRAKAARLAPWEDLKKRAPWMGIK